MPYFTILYYTILYYTILYYTILYYTILYYNIIVGLLNLSFGTLPKAPPSHPARTSLSLAWAAQARPRLRAEASISQRLKQPWKSHNDKDGNNDDNQKIVIIIIITVRKTIQTTG